MTADDARLRTPAGDEISSLSWEEWRLVSEYGLNVLFVGPNDATGTVLKALRCDFRDPIVDVGSRKPLLLPNGEHVGTLILNDIATLDTADQRRLIDWLGRARGRTQVISTSTVAIFPMIAAGIFSEALYYRLNTLYITCPPPTIDS